MKFRLAAWLFLLLALFAGPVLAANNPGDAAKSAIHDLDLQPDLPGDAQKPPAKPSNTVNIFDFLRSGGLRAGLWLVVIIGALLIAYMLRDSLPLFDRSRRITPAADGVPKVARREAMSVAQVEADELARRGRFVEAMHVLLLQSLAEMRRLLGIAMADSLTSREILRRVKLPETGRASLATLIGEVERTHFGEQGADEQDYLACRRQYEILKQSLAAGASA